MKFLLILLATLSIIQCGHIYVSDTQLHYQNTGYLTSAQLYFKLENELAGREILKIVWPYTFNSTGTVTMSVYTTTSTTAMISAGATADASQGYLLRLTESIKLNADQWYILNISASAKQSPTSQYYTTPIRMSTHSGFTGQGDVSDYLMYDYNNACGFLSIAPGPQTMTSLTVSGTETGTTAPTSTVDNKYYEATYPVYLTFLTYSDYEYGGTFYFKITGGFKWTGSCEALSKNCGEDSSCITVNSLTPNTDYICSVTEDVIVFKRFQNQSKLSINHQDYMRIKATVKNPSEYATAGGINVELVSNYAYYLYEIYNKTSQFATDYITLSSGKAKYFWGLTQTDATNKGCPVRMFVTYHNTAGYTVWNKISLPYYPYLTLPDSQEGFKLYANINLVSAVNEISIYTDASAFGSDPVKCLIETGSPNYIVCKNIGKLASNQTKYLKFAFTVEEYDSTKVSDFGQMQIKSKKTVGTTVSTLTITTTAKPSDISCPTISNDANYAGSDKHVVDMTATYDATAAYILPATFAAAITDTATGRQSIKYSGSEMNLFFPITTSYIQQCCDGHDTSASTPFYDCPAGTPYANANCKDINTAASGSAHGDTLILKILANGNALSLSNDDKDPSTTAGNIYKGVELYTPDAATTVGMFGMAKLAGAPAADSIDKLCLSQTTGGKRICSTYIRYVTYTEASTAPAAGETDPKQYLFNQWHQQEEYLELHAVCYTAHDTTADLNLCGALPIATKGVLMRKVTLGIKGNSLYPSQYDIDFLMCFRYAASTSTSLAYDGTTTLASSSVINAQIINFKSYVADMDTSASIFRVGILNYFTETLATDNAASYVPTLLRIGGYLQSAEVDTNEGVAFFFEGSNIKIGSESLSATMLLNPAECGSPTHTGMTCRWFNYKQVNAPTSTHLNLDYYPGLNAITIGGVTIAAVTEFNFYIPVQIVAPAFEYGFLALIQEHSTFPTISKAFKLYGAKENDGADWVDIKVADDTSFTQTDVWTVATEPNRLNGQDWECAAATLGVFQAYLAATPKFAKGANTGWTDSATIYPASTATEISIDASVIGASTHTLNDDRHATTGMKAPELTHIASAHFMVHSQIKYWNGATLTWSMTSTNPFKSQCAELTISSYYSSTVTSTAYAIICPFEGTFATTGSTLVSQTPTLSFTTWYWPDYYGQDAYIGAHLRYLWTDKLGNLGGYLSEAKKSTQRSDCTLGSASSIFSQNTLQKKATLAITPLNAITLEPHTAGEKSKEKAKIILTISPSTTATTTTTQCSSGLSKVKCTVGLSSSVLTFTLTNLDSDNSQQLPNSQISLLFWLSSTSTTADTSTYTGKIYASFYASYASKDTASELVINNCADSSTWTSSSQEDRTITVSDPNRDVLAIGARTPFSFSFSTSYTVLDLSYFTLDLKFLSTANTNLLTNVRCAIYTTTGSTLLHLFDKFTYSSLSAVEIRYKAQDTTLSTPVEIGTVSYKFLCHGGEVMDTAPSSSSLINVKNTLGSTIAEGSGTDQSGSYGSLRTVSGSSYANVTMAKTFDLAGQDSVYTFNIKTQAETTTSTTGVVTTSIRFKAGSYFYVEFARDISPRFNQMGIIRCYHEGNPTYCKYESERRIAFLARSDLNHNQTYGHNFSIIGVQRPADFQNYKKMYFALVPYLKEFNELTYQNSDSVEDASTTDQSATTLPVVYFSQDSGTAIRSTYTMTMHIKMPANTVNENIPIYVDFPGDFDEAMFLGWSPSCQFRNVKIGSNDTISNFANSCSLDNIRRVKINMSSDANNTDVRLYALTISSIPTYHHEQSYSNAPLVWFGNSTATTVPLYKTNLGYFNGTFNLKVFTFSDAGKQLLTWDSNVAECYIGTYRCKAKLRVQNSENFFYDIESITSTGTYADLFKFNPTKLGVETGKPYKEFEIAPKASTSPGYYQLKWNHEQTTYYSVLPPLFIIAHNSQTELNVASSSASYDVPNGGSSLPIIFDFAGKMPETEVTIDGTAKSLEVNGTNYITSKYVTFKASQKTMKFIESYTSSQIQFVVEGKKVTGTGEPDTPSATLSWVLSGTNSGSYKKPNDVTVNVVNAIEGTPVLTLNNPESSSQGFQTITAKCSHASTFYYVVSQDETATQIEYSSIKTASEDANIIETEIGTVYTNPKRTFYGYYPATAADTEYPITITGKLQSEATHYLRMYCVNQMGTPSEKKDINWKQASNGGKPLISAMKFESTNNTNGTVYVQLSTPQKKDVACIICKEAKVEKDKVFGTDGVACSEAGTVVTNTTNSTRRVLQTTTNATEYYVVMPDLFVSSGSLDNVKTKLESTEFRNALAASTTLEGVKLNSITCSINSGYPSLPLINSPSVSPAENSITFSWTGANNTDGFVFVGVAQYTNATVDPTALQLKKNSGYSFDAFNKAFYDQDTAISVTVSPTTKCLDYKYYWVATNEDPDTYQYTTGVKSGTTKTIGCPTFAGIINQSLLLIAFLFVLMILA